MWFKIMKVFQKIILIYKIIIRIVFFFLYDKAIFFFNF